ncbi:CatB-related O-acetyltransferase [Exiguobacterium sp. s149]|uniref:CatB-related O-acetyltransferase n=1 Tax=Exiguobacterium TaxID=33986 RepID=UPI001BEA0F50|nr:CatB-related O-acetyltransferase [Exiguobacterium sp. s149]
MLRKYFPEFILNEIKILIYRFKYHNSFILSSHIDKISSLNGYNKILRGAEIHRSELDKYSYINSNSIVSNAYIGKFTSIGSNCTIGAPEHPINFLSTSPFTYNESEHEINRNMFGYKSTFESYSKKTFIGNDCWIGNNVVVMQGVKIGNGAIVGAGAIVTKDVDEYSIVAGVPAKYIRSRFSEEKINFLNRNGLKDWWDLDENELRRLHIYFDKGEDWFR